MECTSAQDAIHKACRHSIRLAFMRLCQRDLMLLTFAITGRRAPAVPGRWAGTRARQPEHRIGLENSGASIG
jgi:hypothetical protein